MPKTVRITTPFGASSTASEVVAGIDLTHQRAIVTGGASGIGHWFQTYVKFIRRHTLKANRC